MAFIRCYFLESIVTYKNDFVINLQSPNETCTVAPVLKQETHDFADSNLFMPPESFQSVQMRAR